MFEHDGVGKVIAQRMAASFHREASWWERLWTVGTVGALEEALAAAAPGVTETRRQYVLKTARRFVENDPAINGKRRGQLLGALPKRAEKWVRTAHSYRVLAHETESLNAEYFQLWDDYLSAIDETSNANSTSVNLEVTANLLSAHLRTCGLSDPWILNHCKYMLNKNPEPSSLRSLLDGARRVVANGPGPVIYLVPLTRKARFDHSSEPPWLSRQRFQAEFAKIFPGQPIPPHSGGLQFTVSALDLHGAYDLFLSELRRAEKRVRIAQGRRRLLPGPSAWRFPGFHQYDLTTAPISALTIRSLDVHGGRSLLHPLSDELESALDLLTNVDISSNKSAIVTAWAAIETLFADGTDFGNIADIADRAADLLACMYVRDLLLSLATGHGRAASDSLAAQITDASPKRRIELMGDHLANNGAVEVGQGLGLVALQRGKWLATNSLRVQDLRDDISAALRRLYATRNEIVHAGVGEPYGATHVLKSSAVLVGAVIDKAITASKENAEPAGALAAKASWLINRVNHGAPISILGGI